MDTNKIGWFSVVVGLALVALSGASWGYDAPTDKPQFMQRPPAPLPAGSYDAAYDHYLAGNYAFAFQLALARAQQCDPRAQALLGVFYLEGTVVPFDGALAALWFGRAAKQGDPQAALRYGLMLFNGQYVPRDPKRGREFIGYAALSHLPEAYFYYGQLLLKTASSDDDLDRALDWFLRGVTMNDPDSLVAAAGILAEGTPQHPRDEKRARSFLRQASVQNYPLAQTILAQWLIDGRGGSKDSKEALSLLLSAAQQNILAAQIALARFYRDEADKVVAAAWYFLAKRTGVTTPDLETMLQTLTPQEQKQAVAHAFRLQPPL